MLKIAPLLAYSYAMRFAALDFMNTYEVLSKEVLDGNFNLLDYSHHISSGQKAFFTKIAYEGIENLRQLCGGAGFSAWSGLPGLIGDYAPNVTFEGDNTLMAQ